QRIQHLRQLEANDPAVRDALSRAAIASATFHRRLESPDAAPEALKAARAEIAAADQELTRIATDRGVRGIAQVWPEDAVRRLREAVPGDAALVVTAHYDDRDFEQNTGTSRVAAYLVAGSSVQRLDLGPAAPIDQLAEAARLRFEQRDAEGRSP